MFFVAKHLLLNELLDVTLEDFLTGPEKLSVYGKLKFVSFGLRFCVLFTLASSCIIRELSDVTIYAA